ncbi:MAG TPA: protein translocase subunit SecD [Fimbriiglobus sp.]|jgi:SecD/SecF fusion protein
MQRNFLRGLMICLCPLLVATWFALLGDYRKGIDLAGGTILTYEVDTAKTANRLALNKGPAAKPGEESGKLSSDDLKKLAESIKRRIDPADLRNVVVRPVGSNRIEILLPFSNAAKSDGKKEITEDYVEEVKALVSQVGVLEFRILANEADDAEAIRDAQKTLADLSAEDADKLARAGLPPPAPSKDGGYSVKAMSDTTVDGVLYAWVEIGKEERTTLGLNNAAPPVGLKARLKANRGKAIINSYPHTDNNSTRTASMLLYSRDFKKTKPAPGEEKKEVEYFVLTRVSPVDAVKVASPVSLTATSDVGQTGDPEVQFTFNGAGANLFGAMTQRNRKDQGVIRNLCIILDDKVVSAPTLNEPIRDRGRIMGNFTKQSVDRLVYILRSGALTAELNPNPVSLNTVGPTLGEDTIHKGLIAVLASFVAVLIFMLIYYKFAGAVACVALLANLLLTVGFMVAVNAAFTLAGLAGLVLMLGMAVDANVLIYERIREEREKGATLSAAIRNGYDRSLPTILDTHLTSILTAVVLYAFGNDNLKGFSVSLTVGLLISLFTSLYVTRLIFDYAMYTRFLTGFNPLRLFTRPSFNPMKWRYHFFIFTTVLTLIGLGLFLYRGKDGLNVDFNGGTKYSATLSEPTGLTTTDGKPGLMDLLDESRQKKVLDVKPVADGGVSRVGDPSKRTFQIVYGDGQTFKVTLSTEPAPGGDEQAALEAVRERAGRLPDWSVEQIDADIGSGTSTKFTVRTTEKEMELVEVVLSRLLGDKLARTTVELVPSNRLDTEADLTFSRPTSRSVVDRLLGREFTDLNLLPETGGKGFEVEGVETAADDKKSAESKFTRMRVSVGKNPNFRTLADSVESAKAAAIVGGFAGANPKSLDEDRQLHVALADLKRTIDAQPLPESVETFDTALADDTRSRALWAVAASWLMILAYLWFRFGNWTFGLAAVLCLIHDLCFTLGCIAVCHYLHDLPVMGTVFKIQDFKIDLAAVAALLTLVGYSVSDTIVVFDRIREVRGKNPALTPQMINDSVNQTLSRTVLVSLTVLIVVAVLYFLGGNGVHLFSYVMVIGVLVGTYSSIFVASPLLLMFGEGTTAATKQAEKRAVETEVAPQTAL